MSQLFSKAVIKSAISSLQGLDLTREISLVQELCRDLQSGITKQETSYQQRFNNLFFGQLLGYDESINRIPDISTPTGSKKVDVGLGFFTQEGYNYEGVQVVVELKGSGTMLDKKQSGQYAGQTPVDQGFGYKTSFKHCPWLIVSNFGSVRLYKDNKQDYEIRTLEDLIKSDDDYYQLKSLLVILGKKYLISESGVSLSEKRLSEVRSTQETITKAFYQDYKSLRFELINDIRHRNPGVDVETVVAKSQTIIDRIIFIHFCEDKGLLPSGKLKTNLLRGHEMDLTAWEVLKLYCRGVDKGSDKLEIPNGYNGGLFHDDPILNDLQIGDAICHKFIELGNYDFDDTLSVNILGHIFEQSISDIEQLKIDLLGQEMETNQLVEKKESKRKKDGIFYTPEYIVDYIVQHSLMTYLEEQEAICLRKYPKDEIKAYQAYQQIVQHVKVLDPACGSGAFLVNVFDHLYAENKRVGEIIGGLFDETQTYKDILRNNIYGVDLNPESVEITKLSLWLKSAQKGKKLNNLDANIRCGNSLISDPAVAGDRAFDRNEEFKTIMNAGGFDVIVGNPPYVRIQNLDQESKISFEKNYKSAHKNYDLYLLFVEKAYQLISSIGKVGYIMPKKFITTDYGENLKEMIYDARFLQSFVDFGVSQIFDDATTYIGIFIFDKTPKKEFGYKLVTNEIELSSIDFNNTNYVNIAKGDWILIGKEEKLIFDKLQKNNKLLVDFTEKIFQGLVTGVDAIFILEKKDGKLFSKQTQKYYELSGDIVFPLLKGSEIKKYGFPSPEYVIIYPYKIINGKSLIIEESVMINQYSEIFNYLKESENKLREREGGKFNNGGRYGYSRNQNIACMPLKKILTQVLSKSSSLTIDENGDFFFVGGGTAGGYGIILKEDSGLEYKFVLTLLNSKILERFLHKYASPFSGGYYAYSRATMEKLPIKQISLTDQQPFIAKADLMLDLHQQLHESTDRVIRFVTQKYGIAKPSTKLLKFWELDFGTFLTQLTGAKISLADQSELMEYFESKKSEILALKSQIDATDAQIDTMVFDLYGLSEEERRVVLES